MVLNPKINDLAPETALFVHFHDPGTFWGLNQGGGGMLDLEFFKKNWEKRAQDSFLSDVDYIPTIFFYFSSYWGWLGRVDT